MLRLENVATPFTAATDVVPESVPPEGFVPIAMVTVSVAVVTVLPLASWIVTWTAGLIAAPTAVAEGWVVNRSRLAVPAVAVTVKVVEIGAIAARPGPD